MCSPSYWTRQWLWWDPSSLEHLADTCFSHPILYSDFNMLSVVFIKLYRLAAWAKDDLIVFICKKEPWTIRFLSKPASHKVHKVLKELHSNSFKRLLANSRKQSFPLCSTPSVLTHAGDGLKAHGQEQRPYHLPLPCWAGLDMSGVCSCLARKESGEGQCEDVFKGLFFIFLSGCSWSSTLPAYFTLLAV